jgi:hypothetical protein
VENITSLLKLAFGVPLGRRKKCRVSPARRRHTPKLNKFRGKGARTDEPIQLSLQVRRKHLSLSLQPFTRIKNFSSRFIICWVPAREACLPCRGLVPLCSLHVFAKGLVCACVMKRKTQVGQRARELKIQMHSHAMRTSLSSLGRRDGGQKVVKLTGDLFRRWLFH